jgi:NAD(P)H dehydrogenase (quinone)
MPQVIVVYESNYGHTERAAAVVAEGAEQVSGVSVRCRAVGQVTKDDVLDSNALLLGTPVHMGSVHWGIKRFIDEVLSGLWSQDLMVGRVGGVFATGGGLGGAGGGCELAMLSMLSVMAELGMVLVPLPKNSEGFARGGLHWGAYVRCATSAQAQTDIPDHCLPLLREHGANVARVAALSASRPTRSAFDRTTTHTFTRRST